MKSYIVDACALIALLYGETGSDVVADVLNKAFEGTASVAMS